MTFLEMVALLRLESGLSGQSQLLTTENQSGINERLVNWVQQANREIQQAQDDWRFLWRRDSSSLIVNQWEYRAGELGISTPTKFNKLKIVRNLRLLEWEEWDAEFDGRQDETGMPTVAVIAPNNRIYLYPTPDQAYDLQISYQRIYNNLVRDHHRSLVPAQYHDCIVYKALMYYALYESDDDLYTKASMRFGDLYNQLCIDQLPSVRV
ncbi:hypothetical protein [Paraferrimonas sedimenticola]|uniref:Uncharacterized protein n=1 Tax=Paraferrimonas sedimenticola TaxID=375674 RepID=A0AA37VTB5_9GAMM|nr:hypothetical protein [Paraferrimonas sedimenticola]GLP95289.1 hypothetical protein GCM10007895_05950 [Paraferrimonas sedimenticola]